MFRVDTHDRGEARRRHGEQRFGDQQSRQDCEKNDQIVGPAARHGRFTSAAARTGRRFEIAIKSGRVVKEDDDCGGLKDRVAADWDLIESAGWLTIGVLVTHAQAELKDEERVVDQVYEKHQD